MTQRFISLTALGILVTVISMTVHADPSIGSNWTCATSLAPWSSRTLLDCTVYQNKMWLFGGAGSGPRRADVWSSVDGSNWACVTANAPWGGLSGHHVLVHSNMLWLLGGTSDSEYKDFVWNSSDGTNWTTVLNHAPWGGREGFGAVVYSNKMWIMGGYANNPRDVWSSADGVVWTRVTGAAPWGNRARFQSVVHHGKMWVLGCEYGGTMRDDVWSSTDGTNWVQAIAHAPWGNRGQFTTLSDGNEIWVMGGYNGGSPHDVWFSEDGATWHLATAAAPWGDRRSYGAAYYNNALWIVGAGQDVWYSKLVNFVVAITSEPAVVAHNVLSYNVAGTNSPGIIGQLWASNAVNGLVYAFPAAPDWTTPEIALEVGANAIAVYGTDTVGTVASDTTTITRKAATPTGLAVSDGAFTNKVALAWLATPGATSYRVLRAVTNDSAAAATIANAVSNTVYDDMSATPGLLYYYWLVAQQNGVESDASASDSGYRQLQASANIAATLGAHTNAVDVSWAAVQGATKYRVYRADSPLTNLAGVIAADVTDTNCTDGTAVPGIVCYYWVRAESAVAAGAWCGAAPGYALLAANFADRKTWAMRDTKKMDTLICKQLPGPWSALLNAGWGIGVINVFTHDLVSGPFELVTKNGKKYTYKSPTATITYTENHNKRKDTYKTKLVFKFAGAIPTKPGVYLQQPTGN